MRGVLGVSEWIFVGKGSRESRRSRDHFRGSETNGRDVEKIWGMAEVLPGGVCCDFSPERVRALSVLEAQEGHEIF